MIVSNAIDLLKHDSWERASVRTDAWVALYRYRTPVLSGAATKGYERVLIVVWPYAEQGSGSLPSPEVSERMKVFENRFCEAVEHDARAVLVAVLTFDGARQWVFYTNDIADCGSRLESMPQETDPYPIELSTQEDPGWNYLRDEILKRVPYTR